MKAVPIKLLHPDARVPTRATAQSVGYDIYACEDVEIGAHSSATVRTGIALALFDVRVDRVLLEAQVRGRSGLAFHRDLVTHVGTIDPDYRGEIGVKLWNLGPIRQQIKVGDRVAQLVFGWVALPDLELRAELPDSARGTGGFGSTGP